MQGTVPLRDQPMYNYYLQEPFTQFWARYGTAHRKFLFLSGLGFDPRCTPALRRMFEMLKPSSTIVTFCARFTNLHDPFHDRNYAGTLECLEEIRAITRLHSRGYRYEVEVNIFDQDKRQVGESLLIREFDDCLGADLADFTDIIVDVSAFPRSMMYTLIGHLWKQRRVGQNLFVVLTQTAGSSEVRDEDYIDTSYVRGDKRMRPRGEQVWIPVIGGEIDRLDSIHDFLHPTEIFPVLPFPEIDPRKGDELLSTARHTIFDKWGVPFENVMYASGSVPWDVFRKLADFTERHRSAKTGASLVVSALSGRAISVGVLAAALWCGLSVCHAQPAAYYMSDALRREVKGLCLSAEPSLFWLAGELYEGKQKGITK